MAKRLSFYLRMSLIGVASLLVVGSAGAQAALAARSSVAHGPKTKLMSKEAGISADQATRDLETQQTAGNIVPGLTKALGPNYGGVWFNDETNEFNVGITSSADMATAEAVMSKAGVLAETKIDLVPHSWESIEAAVSKWNETLESYVRAQQALAIPNPRTDGVTIEMASTLAPNVVTQTITAAENASVATTVAPVAPENLKVKADACSFPYCERPVRGGIGIQSSAEKGIIHLCTAGFFVRDANGYPYLLTAAHCIYPQGSVYWREPWGTSYPGGKTGCGLGRQIAQVLSENGDAAVIETEGCEPPKPEPDIVAWGIEENYFIKPEPYSAYVGLFECHIGRTGSTQCGYVETANYTQPVNYEEVGKGVIYVKHEDFLCARSEPGDSGGPYAAGHWGTAIATASNGTSCGSFGFELSYALSALGVHMPTS